MRHMKILGLAAIALLALVGATSASASNFTASATGLKIVETTKTNGVFTVTGSSVTCTNVTVTGVTEGQTWNEQSGSLKVEGCTAFGFANATVNTSGCKFTAKAATDEAGMATVNLSGCTAGGITVTVNVPFIAKCVVFIKNQSIASAVSYSNASASDINVKTTASGIHDEVTTSTGACPLTVGTHNNATLTGESTVQAEGGTIQYDA